MRVRQSVALTLLLAIVSSTADAGEGSTETADTAVHWMTKYGNARRASSDLGRPVMLFLTMDGCVHCVRMEHESFQDASLASNLNTSFVPAMVKTDLESRLARELKVTMFPTTVFIAPDGKILDYIRGFISKDDLRLRMSRVMDASAATVASRPKP